MKLNKTNTISLIIFLVAIIASTLVQIYTFDKRAIGRDEALHFYDMKRHYQSGKLPTTSARLIGTALEKEEFTTPRVPGGTFYIIYTTLYRIAGENNDRARLLNLIFIATIVFIFLFWLYKRFGALIASIMSAFIILNPYVMMALTDFWNPHVTLIFSFMLFIWLYEYISDDNQRYSKLGAIFAFPTLALMAQCHLTTFFSMVPTLIVYLIIKHKQTKKYIAFWALGVFISSLLYLPYLIAELQSGFNNINLALSTRESFTNFPFPQLHALLIFPTNEMSVFFGTKFHSIAHFWSVDGGYFIGLPFLFASILFSAFCFIRSVIFFIKTKNTALIGSEKAIREFILIMLLFMPVTLLSFVVAKSKPGTFHYLYSIFAISFSPIMLFFIQIKPKLEQNNKKLYILSVILIINIAIVGGQFTRYIRLFQEPRNYAAFKEIALFIKDDAKDSTIKVYNNFGGNMPYQYEDTFNTYFQEIGIKTTYTNPDVLYSIVDNVVRYNWGSERNDRELEFLIKNDAKIVYDTEGFTVYKFPKPVDF